MSHEMLLGGLMILTMVAGIVIVMTSARSTDSNRFDEDHDLRKDRKRHGRNRRG